MYIYRAESQGKQQKLQNRNGNAKRFTDDGRFMQV